MPGTLVETRFFCLRCAQGYGSRPPPPPCLRTQSSLGPLACLLGVWAPERTLARRPLSLSLPACGCWKQFLSLSCLSFHRKLPEHCCLSHRSNGNWTRLRSFVFTPASATTCVESDVSARFVHPHSQVTLVQQHVCPHMPRTIPQTVLQRGSGKRC